MHAHLRCRRCDLVFVADRPTLANLIAAYERVHLGDYQVRHKLDWEPWMRHKALTLDRLGIGSWEQGPGPHRALDVGCGEGRLLQLLQRRGWRAEGLELNRELTADARRLGLTVAVGAVEQAEPKGPFELITLNHLLEHIREPLAVLRRARGWLAQGGLLVVETPLRPDFDNIDHLYCFSAASLMLALARTGFTPTRYFDYIDDNYRHHNLSCLALAG